MGISQVKLGRKTANSIVRIGIAGFESQSRSALNLFFMQHAKRYALQSIEQADVLILDMEHPGIATVLEQNRSSRPIIAVTATESEFDGLVTLKKPLEGKRLISAIETAQDRFVPGQQTESDSELSAVSSSGEKAFLEYQKRVAAGRQAIDDYQHASTKREELSSKVKKRFELEPKSETSPLKVKATPKKKAQLEADQSNKAASAPTKKAQPSELPKGQKINAKKPQDIKAKLSYQMVYECCGNAPDVNMHEPEQRRRIFFKDDSTLLAVLKEAVVEARSGQTSIEISGLPGTMAYLPGPDCFLFDFSEELMVPLSLTRFGYKELTLKARPDLDVDRPSIGGAKVTTEACDQLLWKVALWTSKGRLNKALDPEQPHRLASELDFERLLPIPHATTISSLWGRHSLSALEVVKVLKINQRYVFSFMSAAHALGVFK